MLVSAPMQDLEEQQTALAGVVDTDFRSRSLIALVSKRITGSTVIDVGCGSGGMVAWLAEHGHDAHGIDSSDRIIEAAHQFLRARGCDTGRVRKRAIEELVASGERFDTVISMDCLEHQADDSTMFRGLAELVRPGGRLLITVPAMPLLFSARDRIVGHHRRYTKGRLRMLAQGAPLRVDELRYWNLLGVPPTFLAAHVTKRAIDESFRYGEPTRRVRALRAGLSLWFEQVENRIRPPVGLTLFMSATRLPG
jgi:SAM-dependent methyltransferase